jgi:hypothetical protein
MVIRIVSAEELIAETTEDFMSAKTVLDFYGSMRKLGITGQAEWAKKDWNVFTTADGTKITKAEVLESNIRYVILAKIFIISENDVIPDNPVWCSNNIHTQLERIFSCDSLGQLKEEYIDGWRLPLFS